jgi:CBS domain containing-hemolysin-like protein
MVQIGHIPVANDNFEAEGLRFEVAAMDGKRVEKVVVQTLPLPESKNSEKPEPGRHS